VAAPDQFALSIAPIYNVQAYLGPGLTPAAITAGAGDLAVKPRFLHVSGAAGSVTYVANGITITEVLEVGYHPIRVDKITAIAGGTTIVAWA